MEQKKTWDLISVSSIPLIMTLGNSMLIPVLPEIQAELEITAFQVSLIITVYSVVAIFMIPIAGYLSDIVGRKKVIIPSLIITGVGGLVAGLASWFMDNPYWVILAGRFIQGLGAAGAAPIVLPLVGDMFRSEKDVSAGLGVIETSNTFGKVLSPILGAYLATIIWYLPFLAVPVFSLISMLLVLFLVKTPKTEEEEEKQSFKQFVHAIKRVFKKSGRWLAAIFIIGIILMFVLFGVLFYLSTLLEERFDIVGVWKGLVLAIPLVALCITSYATGKWIGNNKPLMKRIIVAAVLLFSLSIGAAAFVTNLYILITLIFIHGIGIGAALPSLDALITEGIKKKFRGTITSIYSSMRFIGVAAGPPVVALLMDVSPLILFLSLAAAGVVALIFACFAIKPGDGEKKGNQFWVRYDGEAGS